MPLIDIGTAHAVLHDFECGLHPTSQVQQLGVPKVWTTLGVHCVHM